MIFFFHLFFSFNALNDWFFSFFFDQLDFSFIFLYFPNNLSIRFFYSSFYNFLKILNFINGFSIDLILHFLGFFFFWFDIFAHTLGQILFKTLNFVLDCFRFDWFLSKLIFLYCLYFGWFYLYPSDFFHFSWPFCINAFSLWFILFFARIILQWLKFRFKIIFENGFNFFSCTYGFLYRFIISLCFHFHLRFYFFIHIYIGRFILTLLLNFRLHHCRVRALSFFHHIEGHLLLHWLARPFYFFILLQ